jgi:hypothetical protein
MTHDIMGNNVYLDKEPAWHGLGYVSQKEMGAVEAMGVLEGVFYEKRPIYIFLNNVQTETDDLAIIRSPIPSDPFEKVVGFCKKGYNVVQPLEICEKFDLGTKSPVETLGFLGKNGEKLFLTWKMPSFDVQGDEIKLYGFVACGYDGLFGLSLHIVTVRVVCNNTFTMAIQESESSKKDGGGKIWSGRHNTKTIANDLGIWMEHIQERAIQKSNTAANIFNTMAGKALKDKDEVYKLLFQIYPYKDKLPEDYPDQLRGREEDKIEVSIQKSEKDVDAVYKLFNGEGIAIEKNGFGLFNSVTQFENHVRVQKKPVNYSLLFGNRAKTMTRANNVITAWVKEA